MAEERMYGRDHTLAEDTKRCIKELSNDGYYYHQCRRKRGYGKDGLYCKQHAKMYESRMKWAQKNGKKRRLK